MALAVGVDEVRSSLDFSTAESVLDNITAVVLGRWPESGEIGAAGWFELLSEGGVDATFLVNAEALRREGDTIS